MVEHLVWFRLNDDVTPEQKEGMKNALRALKNQIDGIEHIAVGEDFSGRSRGFQLGLVVRFASREALEIYGPHPAHQAFVNGHKHLWNDVMALDFES
jgi:hypothetical protein